MPDLRERFRDLADDVSGLPRPDAAELRRDVDRRRATRRLLTAAAGAAVAVGSVVVAALTGGGGAGTDRPAPILSPAPASVAPRPDRAWLPRPWALVSSRTRTWAAGTASPYRFCGESIVSGEAVAVAEQVLAHPSGQRARLVAFTGGDPFQLFKFSYASCRAKAHAESVAGPRNLWSYGAVAGGSEMAGGTLHLVEVTGPSEARAATRDDAAAALDAWTR